MSWLIEVIDFIGDDLSKSYLSGWQNAIAGSSKLSVNYGWSGDKALSRFATGKVIFLVLIADECNADVRVCLESFLQNIGAFPDFVAVVSDKVGPQALADFFEYGVENFISPETVFEELTSLVEFAYSEAEKGDSELSVSLGLLQSLREKNQARITEFSQKAKQRAEYDYRAAFVAGKACEAAGDMTGAIAIYQAGRKLNLMFRPTTAKLAESYQKTGDLTSAAKVYEELEKTNPDNIMRKEQLIQCFVKSGRSADAENKLEEVKKIAPSDTDLHVRLKTGILLGKGDFEGALTLLDTVHDVGDEFASSLNEQAIQLAKSGQGSKALQLYDKAHQIVRANIKYKISYNASLACLRLRDFDKALALLDRCQKEFGQSFSKAESVKKKILEERAKSGGQRAS